MFFLRAVMKPWDVWWDGQEPHKTTSCVIPPGGQELQVWLDQEVSPSSPGTSSGSWAGSWKQSSLLPPNVMVVFVTPFFGPTTVPGGTWALSTVHQTCWGVTAAPGLGLSHEHPERAGWWDTDSYACWGLTKGTRNRNSLFLSHLW